MKIMKVSAILAATALVGTSVAAQERFITIGTGGQTGVYFVVGQSICRLVNRGTAEHNLRNVIDVLAQDDWWIDREHQCDQGWRHGHGRRPVRLAVPRLQRHFGI